MRKKREIGITTGIIFLILALVFNPIVDAVKNENESVIITLKLYDSNAIDSYFVETTNQKSKDLTILINSIKAELNKVETTEDTVKIFQNAITSFIDYGIIPESLSIEEIQDPVFGKHEYLRLYNKIFRNTRIFDNSNLLSYISFSATNVNFLRANDLIFYLSYYIINQLPLFDYGEALLITILEGTWLLFNLPRFLMNIFNSHLRELITFGCVGQDWPIQIHPSKGWVWTDGVLGYKNWTGAFYGNLDPLTRLFGVDSINSMFVGVSGFTGICVENQNESFFMGFALRTSFIDAN